VTAHSPLVWAGFTLLVVGLLFVDLMVLNRRSHVLSVKEASAWSAGLVGLAVLFGSFLWWREGSQHALEYFTGYLIELSLSVDNLFVFILIFQFFGVPAVAQPKVLKWGILGAIVLRGAFVFRSGSRRRIDANYIRNFGYCKCTFGGHVETDPIEEIIRKTIDGDVYCPIFMRDLFSDRIHVGPGGDGDIDFY